MKFFIIFLFIVFVLAINSMVGAVCWPYVVNTWLTYCHKDSQIFWYHGILMSFVPGLGQLALPLTIATWLLMIFLN